MGDRQALLTDDFEAEGSGSWLQVASNSVKVRFSCPAWGAFFAAVDKIWAQNTPRRSP
jgi:hypothetical protein